MDRIESVRSILHQYMSYFGIGTDIRICQVITVILGITRWRILIQPRKTWWKSICVRNYLHCMGCAKDPAFVVSLYIEFGGVKKP